MQQPLHLHILHEDGCAHDFGTSVALRDLAATYAVGYKPSGAGGGDFGIAYSTNESAVRDFVGAVHQHITPQLDGLTWTNMGVVCELGDTAAG